METLGQPGGESGLGIGQIDARHADLGKSEPVRFGAQRVQQRGRFGRGFVDDVLLQMHPTILETHRTAWHDEAACAACAQALAAQPALRSAFIELDGPLGAGKTTFARHLLRALGVTGRIKSPSYAVVEPYELPDGSGAWHFDFYRFADEREWEEAGFRDIFAGPGLKLVEWPEHAGETLPAPDLRMELAPRDDDQRAVTLSAYTSRGLELLQALSSAARSRG